MYEFNSLHPSNGATSAVAGGRWLGCCDGTGLFPVTVIINIAS
jgi:hypothetical protein